MLAGCPVLDLTDRLGWLAGRLLADLGAHVVKVEAPAADVESAEWRASNVGKALVRADPGDTSAIDRLAADSAIVLCTPAPVADGGWLPDVHALQRRHPDAVVVAITPFGLTGPKSRWIASDIEIMAAGGAMSLAGDPGGEPMRVTAPQSYAWAGTQAAVGALVAFTHRERTGQGQLVDVSAQSAVITALSHAPAFFDILGETPTRAGAFMTGRSVTGATFRVFWPCRDGFLNFILYGGVAGRRTNEQLVDWMRSSGADLGALAAIDWSRWTPTGATQRDVDAIEAPIARFFAGLTKREFLEEAHRREMLGYPVSTVADISTDPQLDARDFWQVVDHGGKRERHCGAFVVVDGERPKVGVSPRGTSKPRGDPPSVAGGALAGLKVVEFGGYAAGPHIGKLLANYGATVVHVESRARPDGFRLQYPPYKDNEPGIDAGGCFAIFNDSKLGVTLDLKNPRGIALAKRLVAASDVVVENMRPGVMARMGLGFRELSAMKPGLVMLSTCNMGQTGPRADTPGFGSQLSAFAGICNLTGRPDGPPMLLYGPYIDFIASTMGTSAVLAALARSRATGNGAHLDISQYECGLFFVGAALLDYHRDGRIAMRAGNADPRALLHGAWPCANGTWIALSCWTAAERERLDALVRPSTLDAWLAARDAFAAAEGLQAAGIHAHAVETIADLFADPQLAARGQWRRQPHPVIGNHSYCYPPFELAATPGAVTRPAPTLGEHNREVFCGLLGLSEAEYAAEATAGAFE